MVMTYAVGHVSGAHSNPAVFFAFALTRHFPRQRLLVYWTAQVAGALVAALLLRASLGDHPARSLGPAIVSGDLHAAWLYVAALLVGAAAGALVYEVIRGGRASLGSGASA
jgi:glycerol uptake facilitator-like aquaporin